MFVFICIQRSFTVITSCEEEQAGEKSDPKNLPRGGIHNNVTSVLANLCPPLCQACFLSNNINLPLISFLSTLLNNPPSCLFARPELCHSGLAVGAALRTGPLFSPGLSGSAVSTRLRLFVHIDCFSEIKLWFSASLRLGASHHAGIQLKFSVHEVFKLIFCTQS